jgi:DNA-binding transcriptional ArsR family regulator
MKACSIPNAHAQSTMQEVFESVARYFGVLSEPTRLRILHTICQEEKCVNDIIKATGMAQANVSRHLGLMYQAGMLGRRREGTQIFYRVADQMFVELCRSVSLQVMSRMEVMERMSANASDMNMFAQDGLPLSDSTSHQKEKTSV